MKGKLNIRGQERGCRDPVWTRVRKADKDPGQVLEGRVRTVSDFTAAINVIYPHPSAFQEILSHLDAPLHTDSHTHATCPKFDLANYRHQALGLVFVSVYFCLSIISVSIGPS